MSELKSVINRTLGELRRRHVLRLAGVYVIGSWLILQVADVLLDIIAAPEGSLRVVALLLVLVFPMAMVMAWIYDVTPEGVVRTGAATATDEPAIHFNWRWLDFAIIAALLAILVFVLARQGDGGLAPSEHSIGVLPFADLSPEGDNRYFSDGLSEALMDSLARIPGLQVAARTSSFAFRDPGPNVREVADTLNVATLLEGSVRKSGNLLKISARLVDGRSGRHLWNETFDASMEDIFAVQETISRGIADALKIRLMGGEALVPIPTRDPLAYEEYLRGRDQLRRAGTVASVEQAIVHFRRAREIDDDFTLALAGMCTALWEQYGITLDADLAEQAINTCRVAESHEDPPVEVLVALGGLYRGTGQLDRSLALYRAALESYPNDAEVHAGLGNTLREQGKLEQARQHLRRAIELDPAYWRHRWTLGLVLTGMGQLDEAIAEFQRAIRLEPENPRPHFSLGGAYFYKGEYLKAAAAFRESIRRDPNPRAYANAGTLYFYHLGDFVQAEEMFQQAAAMSPTDYRYRAFLAEAIGAQEGRSEADTALHYAAAVDLAEQRLGVNPADRHARAAMASYLAQLGRVERAQVELGLLEQTENHDMETSRAMAMAYLGLGRHDTALMHLARAVEQGYPRELLRADPRLAELAGREEFRRLLADNVSGPP
ncbi:MAG TPA: tetratricopeptide repeat protein [Gammaproteobacteria bacterium]|nr:tetratricopeptide repeat protein [Gammaproteobacteria bacterium]